MMPARILIVDDEPDITTVLKAGLEREGFTVDTFNHPLQALENFKPGLYDMIVLDIRMPEIDGFSLYEKLAAIDKRVKVTFMTAFDVAYMDLFRDRFPFLPEKSYLSKPIILRTFAKLLKTELRIIE